MITSGYKIIYTYKSKNNLQLLLVLPNAFSIFGFRDDNCYLNTCLPTKITSLLILVLG